METYQGGENHTATVTVLFCDLVGSTERQSRLGDEAADTFRRAMFDALAEAVGSTGGETVKNTGDGVMVVFRHSAVDAVTCSVRMHDLVEALDPEHPATIRVGIAAGEVALENGDWFGTPVVEASRLEGAARSGQTLVSAVVQSLVGSRGGHRFTSVGALSLKGLPAPVPAAAVLRGPSDPEPSVVRSSRRRRRITAAMIGAALLVAAVVAASLVRDPSSSPEAAAGVPPAVGYTPTYEERSCPDDVQEAVPAATCGTLVVPEDRTQPGNGHKVRLLVTRAPARGEVTSVPVVDFGADTLASSPVREHAEEIQLSNRGFAPSEPVLTCPEYASVAPAALTRPIGDSLSVNEGSAGLAACHERLQSEGVDTDRYTYADTGEDVLDLLRALELDEVHLVSGYVGTVGALLVVREAPSAVRSLTLQSPVVPGESSSTDPTAHLAEAFDNYLQLCTEDEACAALGDLRAAYAQTQQSYASSPVMVVGDDGDGGKHEVLLDGDRLAEVIADGLFDPDIHTLLASGIATPRGELLDTLSADRMIAYNRAALVPDVPWGALLGARCSYDVHTIEPGHVLSSETRPELSGVDNGDLEWMCAAWPVERLGDEAFDDELAVDVPTLVVQGGINPTGTAEWARQLTARTLTHGTVVTFPTLGRNAMTRDQPPCLDEIRMSFIAQPDALIDAADCEATSPAIAFVGR